MTYRFVGSYCEFGDGTVLEKFGDTVDLGEAEADALISQNAALITDDAVTALEFAASDLDTYNAVALHQNAPAEFIKKRNAAWLALHEHREQLKAGKAAILKESK